MRQTRTYDMEFKIQAVKLGMEIGPGKAAEELGIPKETLYGWNKAAKNGRIDIGIQTPKAAMTLAGEIQDLRKKNKEQEKEIRKLREENRILAEATAFFAASRRKSGKS